jgi:hypothetical protein
MKAKFKTAYLQRTQIVEATLAADLFVDDLVTYNPTTRVMAAATDPTAANAAIIAHSDRSLGINVGTNRSTPYTKTPVEDKTLQYDGKVALSTTAKKVAIWSIKDPLDIITWTPTVTEQLR